MVRIRWVKLGKLGDWKLGTDGTFPAILIFVLELARKMIDKRHVCPHGSMVPNKWKIKKKISKEDFWLGDKDWLLSMKSNG
jgi:hypothetical protein